MFGAFFSLKINKTLKLPPPLFPPFFYFLLLKQVQSVVDIRSRDIIKLLVAYICLLLGEAAMILDV